MDAMTAFFRTSLVWPGCAEKGFLNSFETAQDSFNCSASDGLGLYSALRYFVYQKKIHLDEDEAQRQVALSFLALMDLLGLFHRSMRTAIDATMLQQKVRLYLTRFRLAHGVGSMVPKHHYLAHLPKCMAEQGSLLSCFCHERKHKQVKKVANELRNTGPWFSKKVLFASCLNGWCHFFIHVANLYTYIAALVTEHCKTCTLMDVMPVGCSTHPEETNLAQAQQLQSLEATHELEVFLEVPLLDASDDLKISLAKFLGLVCGSPGSLKMRRSLVATLSTGLPCKKGDLVSCLVEDRPHIAKVMAHCDFGGQVYSLVSPCLALGSNMFRLIEGEENHRWTPTVDVDGSLTWLPLTDGRLTVIPERF